VGANAQLRGIHLGQGIARHRLSADLPRGSSPSEGRPVARAQQLNDLVVGGTRGSVAPGDHAVDAIDAEQPPRRFLGDTRLVRSRISGV